MVAGAVGGGGDAANVSRREVVPTARVALAQAGVVLKDGEGDRFDENHDSTAISSSGMPQIAMCAWLHVSASATVCM